MNSGELKVDVPLASMESDCEVESDSVANTPSKHAASASAASANGEDNRKMGLVPPKILDGGDSLTGSLEDLVNSFDEKLTMCFQDYQEQVDKIAPVQVRTQKTHVIYCIQKRNIWVAMLSLWRIRVLHLS